MTLKKKLSIGKTIMRVFTIVPLLFSLANNILLSIGLEARVAGKNLLILLLMTIVVGSLVITTWLCVLAMLYFYFVTLNWGPIFSFFILMLINVGLLVIFVFIMSRVKNNLGFPILKMQLEKIKRLHD